MTRIEDFNELSSDEVDVGVSALSGNGERPVISNSDTTINVDATNGDDSNDGTSTNPVQTLQEALDRVPVYLRHQYTISLADDSYGSGVIHGAVQSDQSSADSDPPFLRISGNTTTPSNVTVDSIHATGCVGKNMPKVQGIRFTGNTLNEFAGFAYDSVGGNATVTDLEFGATADSPDTGVMAYGGTIKIEGDIAFGSGNRDVGFLAKRHGRINHVGGATVTGTLGNYVFQSTSGSFISFHNADVSATGSTRFVQPDRGGRIFDSSNSVFWGAGQGENGPRGADRWNGVVWAGHPRFSTLQEAIDHATEGSASVPFRNTVLVPPGTYGPINTGGFGIRVEALNKDGSTIIDGADTATPAVRPASGAEIIGFTIRTDSTAAGDAADGDDAIYMNNTEDAVIRDCTIEKAGQRGIYVRSAAGDGSNNNLFDNVQFGNASNFVNNQIAFVDAGVTPLDNRVRGVNNVTDVDDQGTGTVWDGVVGGGELGGTDLSTFTGDFVGQRAMSDGTQGQEYDIAVWNGSSWTELRASGSNTQSGDGTTTTFNIPHGLNSTPSFADVTPATEDAMADHYVTVGSTNIIVHYNAAPPSGSSNLKWWYEAEV